MRRRPRTHDAFSLLEVVIATAVLAVIIIAVLGMLTSSGETFREGMAWNDVEEQSGRILDMVSNELLDGRVQSISADGAVIEVQTPVELNGSAFGSGKQINWGANGQLGSAIRYAFVPLSPPVILDERADKLDHNGDLLIQDTFERVALRRSIVDSLGNEVNGANLTVHSLVPYPPDLVTGLRPVLNLDGDDAGTLDPPFQRVTGSGVASATGSQVRITLVIERIHTDGKRYVRSLSTRAYLRNVE